MSKRRRVARCLTQVLCDDLLDLVVSFICVTDAARLARVCSLFRPTVRRTINLDSNPTIPMLVFNHTDWNHIPAAWSRREEWLLKLSSGVVHEKCNCITLEPEVMQFLPAAEIERLRAFKCVHVMRSPSRLKIITVLRLVYHAFRNVRIVSMTRSTHMTRSKTRKQVTMYNQAKEPVKVVMLWN